MEARDGKSNESPPPSPRSKKYGARSYRSLDADLLDDKAAIPMFVLKGDCVQPLIGVTLSIGRTPVEFEFDTGAAVSIISEKTFNELFQGQQLQSPH